MTMMIILTRASNITHYLVMSSITRFSLVAASSVIMKLSRDNVS